MISLDYVLQGIKRAQAASGNAAPHRRLPTTAVIMKSLGGQGSFLPMPDAVGACFTCFHGFLWSGEATVPSQSAYDPDVHLSMSDESLDSATDHRAIIVRIKASKTDQFRQGGDMYLTMSFARLVSCWPTLQSDVWSQGICTASKIRLY
jgi:hypothetical protein